MSVGELVRRPGFSSLLAGQTVSSIGDWMATVAFMSLALELTGSPTAVGGILALRLLPAAVGGPLAARAAARWDRRTTMVIMDLTRAVMVALVPLISALWWVYVLAFSVEVASLVFLPARDASIPDLVSNDELPVANGLVLASSYATIPLGAALFALLAAVPGNDIFGRTHALVFIADAGTFCISAMFIARLVMLGGSPRRADGEEPQGFAAAFRIPLVRAVLPAAAAVAIGLGALFSLGIIFVREVLDAGDAEFGFLIALFGVGAVGGIAALQAMNWGDGLARTRYGVASIGVIVAAFSLAPSLLPAFAGAAAFGAAAAYTLASGMGLLQSSLAGDERQLAFTAFHVVIRVGLAASAIGAGVAGDLVASVQWPVVGELEAARIVLLSSGLLVLLSAMFIRLPEGRERT